MLSPSVVTIEALRTLPFFAGVPDEVLRQLLPDAEERTFDRGDYIVRQHDEALHFFLLLSGAVQFLIRFEGVDDFLVGTTSEVGAPIGWSAFRLPHRYTASVRCEAPSRALRLPRRSFDEIGERDPHLGYAFLKRVASTLANRLEQARDMLVTSSGGAAR